MSATVPLRHVADLALGKMRTPASEHGPLQVPYLRAANVSDGELHLDDVKQMHFDAAEQRRYALGPGDVLVTEASGSRMQVGQTALWGGCAKPVMFQNHLLRLRPLSGTDGRFLYWWSRHAHGSGMYAKAAQGLAIWHLSSERLRGLPFPQVSFEDQLRIASFLDEQVDLLDRAISLRRQATSLMEKRFESLLEWTLWASSASRATMRLGLAVERVTSGPRGWGDFVGPEGRPFFRSANLRRESLEPRLDNLVRVAPPKAAQSEADRAAVRPGDVLVGITGANAGWVTVIQDAALAGAVVSQHVALIRPATAQLHPGWLAHLLRSQGCAGQLSAMQYGGTKTQLSLPNLRDLRIPSKPLTQQSVEAQALNEQADLLRSYRALAQHHVSLLQERKRSLITAAVTGLLDVSTARSAA
jgi:type I restriction enzyme S subunit